MACKTVYKNNVMDENIADYLFNYLAQEVKWVEGIRSRNGFTRKAHMVSKDTVLFEELIPYVNNALGQLTETKYNILGLYLNYYENGNMYTPNHSHKGTHQLVISLGTTRVLDVGKKHYNMGNGDAIIFGSAI